VSCLLLSCMHFLHIDLVYKCSLSHFVKMTCSALCQYYFAQECGSTCSTSFFQAFLNSNIEVVWDMMLCCRVVSSKCIEGL
jgi:hypothetical protein